MGNFVLLLITLASRATLSARGMSLVLRFVPNDMDEAFFKQISPEVEAIDVRETHATRLVLASENGLRSLSIMNAVSLYEFTVRDNGLLNVLLLRSCLVDKLLGTFRNLHGLSILKVERCRLNGTLNLAELLSLPALTVFSVENNQLTQIDLLLVDEPYGKGPYQSALKQLDLSGNLIEHFSLSVLSPFQRLKELQLNRNRLKELVGEVKLAELNFIALKGNLLGRLNLLAGCNCSALQILHVTKNNLTSFPSFRANPTRVQTLDLTFNALTVVHSSELAQHRHLEYLMLSNNAITTFYHDLETNGSSALELPFLTSMLLADNQLDSLDLAGWQMPSLRVLLLNRNPVKQIPEDLMERYPQLSSFVCPSPAVPCSWVMLHAERIRMRYIVLGVISGWVNGTEKQPPCVPIPPIGCVACRNNDTLQ